jgi:hypothetical protein
MSFLPSGQTVSGQLDGSIYVWEGGAVVAKYDKAHAHGVTGILYCPLGLVTVGCDSQLKVHCSRSSPPLSRERSPRHSTAARSIHLCAHRFRALHIQCCMCSLTLTCVGRCGTRNRASASATLTCGLSLKMA